MKKLLMFMVLCFFAMTACAEGEARKIIIDTDTGADDASAIILAAKSPEVEILGVTVLAGNVSLDQGTENALQALEIAGCDAPVYRGSDVKYDGSPITPFSVFGADGMGDNDLVHPKGTAQEGEAVDFILDTVAANPGEVEIIMIGPATNIAKAIDKNPEVMKQVKRIWSMGSTGIYGHGNASPVAEFNVFLDVPAYDRVLDFGAPMTIVGLDVCDGESAWSDADFVKLSFLQGIGGFITDSFSSIRNYYKQNGSSDSVFNCDSVAMMCLVNPHFVQETQQCHCECITDKGETYGQVIFYFEGFNYDLTAGDYDYNVCAVTEVDRGNFFLEYLSRVLREE